MADLPSVHALKSSIRTTHGTVLYKTDVGLRHKSFIDDDEDILRICIHVPDQKYIMIGRFDHVEVIYLNDNNVAFRWDGKYLCAEGSGSEADFSRVRIGPWERFTLHSDMAQALFDPTYLAIPMKIISESATVEARLPESRDFLAPALTTNNEEKLWTETVRRTFFDVKCGSYTVPENTVLSGEKKILSTRFHAHGVIFDHFGFFHNPGFLGLRLDMKNILPVDGSFSADFRAIQKHGSIGGEYCAVFDGNSFNYYHFLLEGMLSLFILKLQGIVAPPIIVVGRDEGLLKWQREYLNLFGLNMFALVDGEQNDAIVFEKMYWLKNRDLPDISANYILKFREHLLSKCEIGCIDKIYVRRSIFARSVENNVEIENLLSSRGFKIVELETLSVTEQISLFSGASLVVSSHGAGLANLIYCRKSTKLIELVPNGDELRTCFWILCQKMEIKHVFIVCEASHGYGGPLTVDAHSLTVALDE